MRIYPPFRIESWGRSTNRAPVAEVLCRTPSIRLPFRSNRLVVGFRVAYGSSVRIGEPHDCLSGSIGYVGSYAV